MFCYWISQGTIVVIFIIWVLVIYVHLNFSLKKMALEGYVYLIYGMKLTIWHQKKQKGQIRLNGAPNTKMFLNLTWI
jgi:hypothetical protein